MITVTVLNDDEGFYGSASSDEIAKIDHEASLESFQERVITRIRKTFSANELQINFMYGPYSGRSIYIESDDLEIDEGIISDEIAEIIGDVYNDGMFWVEK